MRRSAQGVLREEPSAVILRARVCEGRGRPGHWQSLLGHEAGNGGHMPRESLPLRPLFSYSEGYQRIVGELKGLGVVVSATTVKKILRAEGLGPTVRRGPSRREFLRT